MTTTVKPLLLMDVDGVLNPYELITNKGHTAGESYTKHLLRPRGWHDEAKPALPVLLSSEHGQALRDLAEKYTLVWATTWEDDANTFLGPLFGLPYLPVIEWPEETARRVAHLRSRHRGSWKTPYLAKWLDDYAPGLPWAWVDDEANRHDRAWFARHYEGHPKPVPHLVMRVEAYEGLTEEHFIRLAEFADALT